MIEEQISEAAVFYNSTLLYDVNILIEKEQYKDAAEQLLDAIAFACTNVITFRQLLIRYDAFCRAYDGMPLSEWHLQHSVLDVNHPVHNLFSLDGVEELEKKIIMGLKHQRKQSVQSDVPTDDIDEDSNELTLEAMTAQVQTFVYLLNKTDTSLDKAVAGHIVFKDRVLRTWSRLKQYTLFGLGSCKFKQEVIGILYNPVHSISHISYFYATIRWPFSRI